MEHRILESLDEQRARLAHSLAHLTPEAGARVDLERALEALKRAEHELRLAESDLERRERRARAMIEDAESLRAATAAIELRHRELLETTLEGILRLDRSGRIMGLNDRAARLFGRRPHEMIGHPIDEFIDEDLPTLAARDLERRRLGREHPIEVAGRRKDGSRAWFAVSSHGSTHPHGAPAGALVTLTEVTARVEAEQALQECEARLRALTESNLVGMRDERAARMAAQDALSQHLATLEEVIRERTAALQETNDQLAAFSFTVTHDLRAPLRAVRGFAEALLEDYGDRLDATGRGYAERMVAASRVMDVLILDLLAYSRISRIDLERERVDLGEVVRQALDTLEREVTETGARIDVEPALPEVMGHRAALLQAVTNLLSNALKFVAAGETPRVSVRAERRPGTIRLWVEDQGIGIAPEYQERVFAPFERLHQGDRYPGTGVGLAMVRKALERLGGAAGVESAPGLGSRFWIEVPDGPLPAGSAASPPAMGKDR